MEADGLLWQPLKGPAERSLCLWLSDFTSPVLRPLLLSVVAVISISQLLIDIQHPESWSEAVGGYATWLLNYPCIHPSTFLQNCLLVLCIS